MADEPGVLVVLEGIDGSGKSTLARGLAAACGARGYDVVLTREPTDGPFGRRARSLSAADRAAMTAEEEFLLFHEDRKAHVAEVVRPALEAGRIVIQDRSYFSSIVYQGERGLDADGLYARSEAIAPRPDLLLVVDVPVEEAMRRILARSEAGADGFERAESLARMRTAFRALVGAQVVDGQRAAEALCADCVSLVLAVCRAKGLRPETER